MTATDLAPGAPPRIESDRPLSIAILAMGGQGGAVLSDWIVAVAEAHGWFVQATSVPGVAQRTGATIYYIEMLAGRPGLTPVLALMPSPGDVDVVLAAEFMEAGRSMLRGLVTPDRTTLIASTHRALAVVEKEKPGNGIGDSGAVVEAAGVAAKRIVAFDMQALAERNGTVISAALFGALAGADVLPFDRGAFAAVIEAGERGAKASLKAFEAAFERARRPPPPADAAAAAAAEVLLPASAGHPALDQLLNRVRDEFPVELHAMIFAGLSHVVDFQDVAYGHDYLGRLAKLLTLDRGGGGAARGFALTREAAKYLANALRYDDVIRVADLKTRRSRFERIERESATASAALVTMTEFMHPRLEEVVGALPLGLGRFIEARPRLSALLDSVVNRGRRVRTGTIPWFLVLYLLAGCKRFRRGSLRHAREMAHIESWLGLVREVAPRDYGLGVEILRCRRLVKGYSDTHARGLSKFDLVLSAVPKLVGEPEGAAWLRRLVQAALADQQGTMLEGALKTVASAYDLP